MKKFYLIIIGVTFLIGCESSISIAPDFGQNFSTGGSTAQFAVAGNYLYTIDHSTLTTFNISDESNIVKVHTLQLDWRELETIFPYGDILYLGSTTGVLLISIANPASPNFISEYQHVVSCDPVVVQGQYAYSTLRSGNTCGQFQDVLEIIDISNSLSPQLVASYDMESPRGLTLNGNYLYVCDNGIKVLDITDVYNVRQVNKLNNIPANDAIFFNNQLLVTADDGFYQFNVVNGYELLPLGHFVY